MQFIESLNTLRELRQSWRSAGHTVAFVPTMGNLHDGHLDLVKQAKVLADKVVVSIFVNPMQFGANEDLDAYPRTLDADRGKLEAHGVDALFFPAVDDVFPRGLSEQTFVEVPGISDLLCGASRPGNPRAPQNGFDSLERPPGKLIAQRQASEGSTRNQVQQRCAALLRSGRPGPPRGRKEFRQNCDTPASPQRSARSRLPSPRSKPYRR